MGMMTSIGWVWESPGELDHTVSMVEYRVKRPDRGWFPEW